MQFTKRDGREDERKRVLDEEDGDEDEEELHMFNALAAGYSQKPQVRVAALQMFSAFGDVKGNIANITVLCEQAASQGAKIVVLPECATTGYLSYDLKTCWLRQGRTFNSTAFDRYLEVEKYAEPVPGPTVNYFAALAKRLGVYITVTLVESALVQYRPQTTEKVTNEYYNSVVLVSPRGLVVGHYRKTNPWKFAENSWVTPARKLECFDTEYGRLGFALGQDVDSNWSQYMALGVWTILNPMCWKSNPVTEWFQVSIPQMMRTQFAHLVTANWTVPNPADQSWEGHGMTSIYGPNGVVLASASVLNGQEIVFADLPIGTSSCVHMPPVVLSYPEKEKEKEKEKNRKKKKNNKGEEKVQVNDYEKENTHGTGKGKE
jgi:predicted amidohydrolase